MKKILIYDFDGTLTPYPITKFKILDKCGLKGGTADPKVKEVIAAKRESGMEHYEAIYTGFLELVSGRGFELNDDNMSLGADELEYNNGVFEFLEEINNMNVDNYLLSSGIKVLLERTHVAKYFEEIYATTFSYKDNLIVGTGHIMSDKKKVDVIKEIVKNNGVEDCRDVVYLGDGLTDLYAMEYVKDNGGTSIFVYLDPDNKELVMAKEKNCVSLFTLADYSKGSELYNYIMNLCVER